MPMGDKDIRQLFELDGNVIRWKEVPVAGLPMLFLRAAQKHNQKAGQTVQFWSGSGNSKMVTVAGVAVTVERIMKVLNGGKQRPAPEARRSKAAKPPKGEVAAGAPKARTAKPWDDPSDPRAEDGVTDWEWLERNAARREAWEKVNGKYDG
jgi:hypothetical protein